MKFRREVLKVLTKRQKRARKRSDRERSFEEAEQELTAIDAELEAFVKMEMEDWGTPKDGHHDFLSELEDRRSEESYGFPQDVIASFVSSYVELEASYLVYLARTHAKKAGMFEGDFLTHLHEVVRQASDRLESFPGHVPVPVRRFLQDFVVPTAQAMGEDGKRLPAAIASAIAA